MSEADDHIIDRWPFDHQKTRERAARTAFPDFGRAALHLSNARPTPNWVAIAERRRHEQRTNAA